ncbi:MAG: hypothetical protein Q9168_007739, partial [Polycauliona sp. 1 TL-2023]
MAQLCDLNESRPMSIEDYNYQNDHYHSTDMPTKYPLPWLCESPDTALEARGGFERIERLIHAALDFHGLSVWRIHVQHLSKPGYPIDGDVKRPGVLAWVDIEDPDFVAALSPARRDISHVLHQQGLGDLIVDIQDPCRSFQPLTYPILSTDVHTIFYASVREKLLEIVRSEIPLSWISLGLFYVGSSFGDAIPAVTLMVRPYTTHNWHSLRTKLRRAMLNDLEVKIFPGQRGDLEKAPAMDFSKDFTPCPKMGSSIGVVGGSQVGTLGGFFDLSIEGKLHRGFLTTSKVVAPVETASQAAHERFNKHGVLLPTRTLCDAPERRELQYMALKDTLATRDSCLRQHQQLTGYTDLDADGQTITHEGSIAINKRRLEERRTTGVFTELYSRVVRDQTEKARRMRLNYQCLSNTMTLALGETLLASPPQAINAKTRKIIDWAFVSCSTHPTTVNPSDDNDKKSHPLFFSPAFGNNKLPTEEWMKSHNLIPEDYINDLPYRHRYFLYPNGQPPNEYGKIKPDRWYCKVGRTTGVTAGVCNGVGTFINMAEPHYSAAHNLNSNSNLAGEERERSYTEESLIIPAHTSHRIFLTQQTFSHGGDEGALVFDYQGRICGLLIGN